MSSSSEAENEFLQKQPTRVAVVGGGLAGIAASWALSEAKIAVDLYETKSRLAGRVGSFSEPVSNTEYDYCQHVGMQCCTNLTYLIEQLGLSDDWRKVDTLHFFDSRGQHVPLRGLPLPAPLHLAGLLLRWPGLFIRDRIQIASAIISLLRLPNAAPELDELAINWLRAHRQSENAIDKFWTTILVSALGETVDRVALRPARKVLLEGFAANRSAYQLVVPQRPLSSMFDEHASRILRERNVRVYSSTAVDKIALSPTHNPTVITNNSSRATYSAVISAVPWFSVGRILGEYADVAPEHQPSGLKTSPITGIHTWWDKPWLKTTTAKPTELPHAILIDQLCQWIFPKPNSSMTEDAYYQIVISASRDVGFKCNEDVEHAIKQDLRKIFPGIIQARMLRCKVITDPRSVFSVSPESIPRRWTATRLASQKLFFAGDWTATGWPATMEGAVKSGFIAAAETAALFDKKIDLPRPNLPHAWLIRLLNRSGEF